MFHFAVASFSLPGGRGMVSGIRSRTCHSKRSCAGRTSHRFHPHGSLRRYVLFNFHWRHYTDGAVGAVVGYAFDWLFYRDSETHND